MEPSGRRTATGRPQASRWMRVSPPSASTLEDQRSPIVQLDRRRVPFGVDHLGRARPRSCTARSSLRPLGSSTRTRLPRRSCLKRVTSPSGLMARTSLPRLSCSRLHTPPAASTRSVGHVQLVVAPAGLVAERVPFQHAGCRGRRRPTRCGCRARQSRRSSGTAGGATRTSSRCPSGRACDRPGPRRCPSSACGRRASRRRR